MIGTNFQNRVNSLVMVVSLKEKLETTWHVSRVIMQINLHQLYPCFITLVPFFSSFPSPPSQSILSSIPAFNKGIPHRFSSLTSNNKKKTLFSCTEQYVTHDDCGDRGIHQVDNERSPLCGSVELHRTPTRFSLSSRRRRPHSLAGWFY